MAEKGPGRQRPSGLDILIRRIYKVDGHAIANLGAAYET